MNKLQSFFILAITSLFLINTITAGSLWYIILLLRSCLKEIRLESYLSVRAILYNLILSLPASDIKTISISSV